MSETQQTANDPASGADDAIEALDFENALKRLEVLVARMETGTLSLEESLRCYEQGTQLSQRCKTMLEGAELRLAELRGPEADAEPEA